LELESQITIVLSQYESVKEENREL
jgi:hypothetical protein